MGAQRIRSRRSVVGPLLSLCAVVLVATVGGCVAPGATPTPDAVLQSGSPTVAPSATDPASPSPSAGSASASPSASADAASASPRDWPGLGVARRAVMDAIDEAVAPSRIDWQSGKVGKDGVEKLEGWAFGGVLSVGIYGPPDDVIGVEVLALGVGSAKEAPAAGAIVDLVAPEAKTWWLATFTGEPAVQTEAFGEVGVAWARDTPWLDGSTLSVLFIGPTSILPKPKPTPTPTPTPTPGPTPVADLMTLLPANVDQVTVVGHPLKFEDLTDDDPCYPLCAWQVRALADARGIDVHAIRIVRTDPIGAGSDAVSLALIQVPAGDAELDWSEWIMALQTGWPKLVVDGHQPPSGNPIWIVTREHVWPDDLAPAWYVRTENDVLMIVGDADVNGEAPPSQRVLTIFDLLS